MLEPEHLHLFQSWILCLSKMKESTQLTFICSKSTIKTHAHYKLQKKIIQIYLKASKMLSNISEIFYSLVYNSHTFIIWSLNQHYLSTIYLFKVNNKNSRKRNEICSKLNC